MKRRIKNKVLIVLLIFLTNIMLTGCVDINIKFKVVSDNKLKKDTVSCEYNKRIKSIVIENNIDKKIYIDYDILLLNKENEVLYKAEYKKVLLEDEEKLYNNLEDIKPDYMEYEAIEKMNIKLKNLYKYNILTIMGLVKF